MKILSDVKLLELTGDPRDRGRFYGETLKPMIWEVLERWKYEFHRHHQMNPDTLVERFIENTNFLAAVKKWTPHLLEEVRGIGEGAEVDFETIFALQCGDEEWWYREFSEQHATERCSALGCFKESNRPALSAQTMDISNIFEGLEVLLHIKHPEGDLESFVLTFAGMIALCGLNNQPVSICCNSLVEDLNRSVDGLPVAFIVRAVLEQLDLDNAIEFIHKIKHASGQNYVIGGVEKVVSFECSANKISQYIPYEGARRVYHTNHPLVNEDLILPPKKKSRRSTTHERFNYLESRLKNPTKSVSVETIKYILSSHHGPICVHHHNGPGEIYTFGSVIYSLSTPPELYLTIGPPCSNKYTRFTFK